MEPARPQGAAAAKEIHASLARKAKLAQAKTHAKPQPGLVAAYSLKPGKLPQFDPARVVRDQAHLSELIRSGNVGLFSAIAYCDRKGEMHTGRVLDVYAML